MRKLVFVYLLALFSCNIHAQGIQISKEELPLYDLVLASLTKKPKSKYPQNIWVGEQLFMPLRNYVDEMSTNSKPDSLTILLDKEWAYLKVINLKNLSPGWQNISTKEFSSKKKDAPNNHSMEQDLFSPVIYSGNGNLAFFVYRFTRKNVPQYTVFYFFRKKNGSWNLETQQVPFL